MSAAGWPRIRTSVRRAARRVRRLPPLARALAAVLALAAATVAWQLVHKPTELLTAVVPAAPKTPAETWQAYGPLFEAHATGAIRPTLLAALAQAESGGDPLASPPWRVRLRLNPLDLYGPASTAVGLLQITDGNLAEARELCVRDHEVARAGAWHDPSACWLNGLYARIAPGDSIEMTSAWLDVCLRDIAAARRIRRLGPQRELRLAAVVHLCGRGRGAEFARRGFWVVPGERCGEHDLAEYLGRVERLAGEFERLRAHR